jgi:protein O-GlcNAc transferase
MAGASITLPEALRRAVEAYSGGSFSLAERLCHDIVAAKPDLFEAMYLMAVIQARLGRRKEALASYERALAIRPDYADALTNRGNTLRKLKRFEEALASYEKAMAIKPDCAGILYNRGNTLLELRRFEDALASYEGALAIKPDNVVALTNRGVILFLLKRFDEALASYEKAIALDPDHKRALRGLGVCALKICDWMRLDKLFGEVSRHVSEQKSIIPPFLALAYSGDQSLHLICAKNYIRERAFDPPQPLWRGAIWRNHKIKIAYLSADFRRHTTAEVAVELIELHDRSQFEVIGISFGADDGSEMRARIASAFDRFFDVSTKSDRDVARLLDDLRIDITVDLQGHHSGARPGILALRPAPIQVNFAIFPGTMGADFIDYIIADAIVLPLDRQPYYTERIVHLPDCYQVKDRRRIVAARTPTRAEVGLPAEGFVFCCFNNNRKFTPGVFDVWMRLLRALEGSVLWLLSDNKDAEKNLRKEAASRGVDPERLVFAKETKIENHLARQRLADLFLDTLPYNAHATASDALWAGLPLLTCQGEAFAGRVAASLLCAIGLSELVTHNLEDYETLALRLAREPNLLRAYRDRLAKNRLNYPLFDTDRFRRNIEAAYRRMWELWQADEKPRSFAVAGARRREPTLDSTP